MRRFILFMSVLSFTAGFVSVSNGASSERFAVYYSDAASPDSLSRYQLLVLDSQHHPQLQSLAENNAMLLGYISLGEINKDSPYFPYLKKSGIVLQENKNWKGSYTIDVRSPVWQKLVVEQIIPSVLRDGFNGVFFDTLDSPLELERANPLHYRGMGTEAVHLIQMVRMHYPTLPIMVNRAYPILPRIVTQINMELGESVLGDHNFDTKTYGKVDPELYHQQVQWLQQAKLINPQLKVYTLDYADKNDRRAIADLYRQQRANGFIPYVATVGLDEIIDEPGT